MGVERGEWVRKSNPIGNAEKKINFISIGLLIE